MLQKVTTRTLLVIARRGFHHSVQKIWLLGGYFSYFYHEMLHSVLVALVVMLCVEQIIKILP